MDSKKSSGINRSELILCLDVDSDITSFKKQQIFLLTSSDLKIVLNHALKSNYQISYKFSKMLHLIGAKMKNLEYLFLNKPIEACSMINVIRGSSIKRWIR